MASLFNTLKAELNSKGYETRSREAKAWFTERVKELNGRINRKTLLNDEALKSRSKPIFGHMFMFAYDPKFKEELPYYDRFPLVIALQPFRPLALKVGVKLTLITTAPVPIGYTLFERFITV